jgi:uncharacterized protein YdiU (UPF0061 family)
MDRIISEAVSTTSEAIDEQLHPQRNQDMDVISADYTRQIAEITQARNAALSEPIRITEEGDTVKAECDGKAQRIEDLLQVLENTRAELREKKTQFKEASEKWEEEKSKLERRCKKFKDKLALTTAAMEKRLVQAEQREEAERAEKKELWNLNEDVTARNRRIDEEALKAKASHEERCRKYSVGVAEKIDLIHQYAVSWAD